MQFESWMVRCCTVPLPEDLLTVRTDTTDVDALVDLRCAFECHSAVDMNLVNAERSNFACVEFGRLGNEEQDAVAGLKIMGPTA